MKLKPVLYGRVKKDKTIAIKIRLMYKGQPAYFNTKYSVLPEHFDTVKSEVKSMCDRSGEINLQLAEDIAKYKKAILILEQTVKNLNVTKIRNLILDQANNNYHLHLTGNNDFFQLALSMIEDLKQEGRDGHAMMFKSAITVLSNFVDERSLHFHEISYEFLKSFKRWYVPRYGKEVTFYGKCRYIRMVFNEAIKRRIIPHDMYPFRHFEIKNEYSTDIRALDIQDVAKIYNADGLEDARGFGRDFFMLSFYFCGMNAKDICKLPYSKGDYIFAERDKVKLTAPGKSKLQLLIQPEAREIIDRYPDPEKKYLVKFPHVSYTRVNCSASLSLKALAKDIGLSEYLQKKISAVWARHSWATIGGELDIHDRILDTGLMHVRNEQIEKYRRQDFSKVDDANRKIIDEVKKVAAKLKKKNRTIKKNDAGNKKLPRKRRKTA